MSLLIKLPHGTIGNEAAIGASDAQHRDCCTHQIEERNLVSKVSLLHMIASEGGNAQRKGRVQSAIAALFHAQPDRVFTAVDLAQAIHGRATRTTCKTIRRAADSVAREMGWTRRRMWGRVDYVRPDTLNAITRRRVERAAELMELGT